MAIEIVIPRLGWSMDEGTFGDWLKADGEFVQAGEAIFTLESEKALQEVESVDSGILRILHDGPQGGDIVSVGTLIGHLVEEGEPVPQSAAPTAVAIDATPVPGSSNSATATASPPSTSTGKPVGRLPRISPRAKRLATEHQIDWTELTGSGSTGRIRERDVVAALHSQPAAAAVIRPQTGRLRRVIADRMMQSVSQTAPVTLTTKVDASNLVGLREQFKKSQQGFVPAYQDIIMKLAAYTLRIHPELRYQWQNGDIVEPEGLHLGLAVDTEAGLLVPVIRDCDRLSLRELTTHSQDLIERARSGKCGAAELSGGVFTITNLGAYGIDAFTPILNTPETAILGLGAIRREAVVLDDDRIVPRHQLTLSLTFDHRVVDGAPAARFLQALAGSIENPGPTLIW